MYQGAAAAIPVQYVDPFNGINPAPNDPRLNERSDEWIRTNFKAVSFRDLFHSVKESTYIYSCFDEIYIVKKR